MGCLSSDRPLQQTGGSGVWVRDMLDMVEWLNLFNVLVSRNVAPVFLRTLLFIYSNQSCDVKWNGSCSRSFRVSNGIRQGAVSSPILFSIYINDLFFILRSSGLSCRIHAAFFGCLGYADDLLLLSASRSGLQSLVIIYLQALPGRKT